MIGRIDDHVRREVDRHKLVVDPTHLPWAGIAVFKRAHALYRARGYQATLLAAAYRHVLHWSELVGDGVVQSIPFAWWTQFDGGDVAPRKALLEPVDDAIFAGLSHVEDFTRAMSDDAIEAMHFARYGASTHTLKQFLEGTEKLVHIIRDRMLP
jgi:transaldolase